MDSAEDLWWELGLSWAKMPPPGLPNMENTGESDHVLSAIGYDATSMDELMARTGLAADMLSARQMEWEFQGTVCVVPGGKFQRMK